MERGELFEGGGVHAGVALEEHAEDVEGGEFGFRGFRAGGGGLYGWVARGIDVFGELFVAEREEVRFVGADAVDGPLRLGQGFDEGFGEAGEVSRVFTGEDDGLGTASIKV